MQCFIEKQEFSLRHGLETDRELVGLMYEHKDGKGFTQCLKRIPGKNKPIICRFVENNSAPLKEFECFDVKESFSKKRGRESEWENIGTMYPLKGGEGYTQYLTKLPRGKKVVCRLPLEKIVLLPPPAIEMTDLSRTAGFQSRAGRYEILKGER